MTNRHHTADPRIDDALTLADEANDFLTVTAAALGGLQIPDEVARQVKFSQDFFQRLDQNDPLVQMTMAWGSFLHELRSVLNPETKHSTNRLATLSLTRSGGFRFTTENHPLLYSPNLIGDQTITPP